MQAYDNLPAAPLPLFAQLADERKAPGGAGASGVAPSAVDAALRSGELRDLAARLLENTVLNLMKDAVRGEFDLTRPPVTVLHATRSTVA